MATTRELSSLVSDRPYRGIAHLLHPQVLGVIIGGAGASAFVHVNRASLPDPWPTIAMLAWALTLIVCAWAVLWRPRRLADPGPVSRYAGPVYGASVLGMLAMFAGGHAILAAMDRVELQPAVIVLAVGLHFIPFASVFGAPVFAGLGWSVTVIGVAGLALGALGGGVPIDAAAVATGIVMLAFMAGDALRDGGVA